MWAGGAIDAYLAMALPFAWWALTRARRPLGFAVGAVLLMASWYVVVTTYSRGILVVAAVLSAHAVWWQSRQSPSSRPAWWRPAWRGLCLLWLVEVVLLVSMSQLAGQRLAQSLDDTVGRWRHWQAITGLMTGPSDLWRGLVLGARNMIGIGVACASAGLIVSEGTQISQQGQGYAWTPGIHSAEQVQGWRQVTDAVHAAGGRIVVGVVVHLDAGPLEHRLVVVPGGIADPHLGGREVALEQIGTDLQRAGAADGLDGGDAAGGDRLVAGAPQQRDRERQRGQRVQAPGGVAAPEPGRRGHGSGRGRAALEHLLPHIGELHQHATHWQTIEQKFMQLRH